MSKVWVEIDGRILHGHDDNYLDEYEHGTENVVFLATFDSEADALVALEELAADWGTELVAAEGYVDFDGGEYCDSRGAKTYIFNGPVLGQEIQGFAWVHPPRYVN